MKRFLLLLAAAALSVTADAQRLIQDLQITGTGSQVKSGTLTVKSAATITAESGAVINLAAAALSLPAWVPVLDTTLTPATNDVLVWNATSSKWQRKTLVGGTGVTITSSSGALTFSSASGFSAQTSNLVLAGPTSGGAAVPAFRPLVTADLPSSGVTAGTYGSSSLVPVVTVDATGRVTSAASVGIAGSAGGTVTSVALALPSIFSVSGSPVTSSGTLTGALANQSANLVLAGPSTGSATTPTFRALAAADLPTSGVSAGTYGSASQSPQITVDAAGRVTAVTNVTISGGGGGGGGGGDMVHLASLTASGSASLDFTSAINSTYDVYVVEFLHVLPATSGANLQMTVSTDAGSTWEAGTGYFYDYFAWRTGGTGPGGNASVAFCVLYPSVASSAGQGVSGRITIYDPLSTTSFKSYAGKLRALDTAFRAGFEVAGSWESTTAVNALRFAFSSGNIASGTIRIYGLAH